MSELDRWLEVATRSLSKDAKAKVRSEIHEHYESAREVAIQGGASIESAERQAVAALGDAKTANCQYRNVLLTSSEASLLKEANWEARAVCSRAWLKWVLVAMPVTMLVAAAFCFFRGALEPARILLLGSLATGLVFAPLSLPLYTPSRGRIYRAVKCVVLFGGLVLAFGADALKWSWLLGSCLWIVGWIEWRRNSIRRKLPVTEWPKQLYL